MFWNTVSAKLREILLELSNEPLFEHFTLVGGTALSLQIGHRKSEDIDFFTDQLYGSIDMDVLAKLLEGKYPFYRSNKQIPKTLGFSCYIGPTEESAVKLDLFYTDPFVYKIQNIQAIQMASIEEIIAMKLEVITQGGRKKDFWDLHYFIDDYTLEQFYLIHEKRYPYISDKETLKRKLIDFERADSDFDPICLLNKSWELIKYDFLMKFA